MGKVGRRAKVEVNICILMTDSYCMAKTTQQCKAIILQLKIYRHEYDYPLKSKMHLQLRKFTSLSFVLLHLYFII